MKLKICDCGRPILNRFYNFCDNCIEQKEEKKYAALPESEIDIINCPYVYSDLFDIYFDWRDWDELYCELDKIEDEDYLRSLTLEKLRLQVCEQTYLNEIDIDDLFESSELSEEYYKDNYPQLEQLEKAIDCVNEIIKNNPIGYIYTNKRVSKKELGESEQTFQESINAQLDSWAEEFIKEHF